MVRHLTLIGLLAVSALAPSAAEDWPQFRGLHRDGRSPETGLLDRFSEDGPPELWRVPIGPGFSAVVTAGQRAYTMGSDDSSEYVVALSVIDGREVWRARLGDLLRTGTGDGPRSTPTVQDGRIWAVGSYGDLVALHAGDGREMWRASLASETKERHFGVAVMPLLTDGLVVVDTGVLGRRVLAFHQDTGKLAWQVDAAPSFSSPIEIPWHDRSFLAFFHSHELLALSTAGETLWRIPFGPAVPAGHPVPPKVAMPVFVPPDLVLVSASYDLGTLAVRLRTGAGGRLEAVEAWSQRRMRNQFQTSVAVGGLIFGFDHATLKCLDAKTGEERWAQRGGFGKGSLIWADGRLIVLTEQGRLLLVEATDEGYRELATAPVLEGRTWTPPSLSDGRLYLRGSGEVVALDLRASEAAAAANMDLSRDGSRAPRRDLLSDARAVVDRYLAASGAESVAQLGGVRMRGYYLMDGTTYPCTIWYRHPDRYRLEVKLPGGGIAVNGFDGHVGWRNGTDTDLAFRATGVPIVGRFPAEEAAYFVEDDLDVLGQSIDGEGVRVVLEGAETLDDGQDVYHLTVTLPSGHVQHWYIDRESFRLVRKRTMRLDPVKVRGLFERRWDVLEHRRFGGVLFPVFFEREDFQIVRTFRFETVEVGVQLDDALFSPPEP